jgi:RimJ/RimL family protein N-acetyltransferase
MSYLFQSARLGFRNWHERDIAPMAAINADAEVMKYFPAIATFDQTATFIERMQLEYAEKGYCYFAVDEISTDTFIGFIGLSWRTFEADFTPCVDIGWRLSPSAWNKGYATEGAIRCLDYAFGTLELDKVYSMAPKINTPSERVMQKAGMKKVGEFEHPLLKEYPELKECVLYLKSKVVDINT